MAHKIYPAASERLLEIWEYTDRKWGEEQADTYIAGLFVELDKITSVRRRWKPVREPEFEGVYFAKYQRHFIFFRELGDGVLGVISVLHEAMNIPDRLKEDVDGNN